MLTQTISHNADPSFTAKGLEAFKAFLNSGSPHLAVLKKTDDLKEIAPLANRIRNHFSALIVVGTGGSSLGGKMLYELRDTSRKCPVIHFLENVDPTGTQDVFNTLDWPKTFFLFVSKSGGTLETLSQVLLVLKHLEPNSIAQQCAAISDPKDSALRQICTGLKIPVYDHEAEIGGRYSVFSNVGLLPAAVAGLDVMGLREGAIEYSKNAGEAIASAASYHMQMMQQKTNLHVLMPYSERLKSLTDWHRQLWAESIGKEGKGTTPIRALGAVDQHSQIQLYLGGPKDKYFTFLATDQKHMGESIWPDHLKLPEHPDIAYLKGKTLGDIIDAEQWATIETFKSHKLPVRVLKLADCRERTIGALLMHFILETIITAALMNVNPYDQPAVEDGKKLAKKMLAV
jgi:glucose-6-phosphate isomerase